MLNSVFCDYNCLHVRSGSPPSPPGSVVSRGSRGSSRNGSVRGEESVVSTNSLGLAQLVGRTPFQSHARICVCACIAPRRSEGTKADGGAPCSCDRSRIELRLLRSSGKE